MTIAIWKNFIFTGSYDGIINKWNLNLGSKNRALLLNAQSNLLNCFFPVRLWSVICAVYILQGMEMTLMNSTNSCGVVCISRKWE